MRNLKKFLALVLAMMMTLSLMVTANAKDITADFTDADSVTEEFTEAVDVLNGMKVFRGYSDGTFDPKGTITRAEMAAIIYRLHTGDAEDTRANAYVGYDTFTDVEKDKWYAGYVGYCANAGLIAGYGNGRFGPSDKLTGYHALVMLLRAMGYDQPGEFSKSDWRTHAASIATQRGMLGNVNKTNYKGTLSDNAARELVAELTFQAAQLARVKYTPAYGYQTGDHTNQDNYVAYQSLGELWYGLTCIDGGVIVGNQDTGETSTKVKTIAAGMPGWYKYLRQTSSWDATATAAAATGTITSIDAKTGLDMFGHAIKVWYNKDTDKTYALYDQVKKTALVTAASESNTAVLSTTGGTYGNTDTFLGQAAQNAGFNVNLANSETVFNYSFGVSTIADHGQASQTNVESPTMQDGGTATAYPLYLLISNNSANTVDMVVALNTEVTAIAQTDNVAKYPTVTLPLAKDVDTFVDADADAKVTINADDNYGKVTVAALTGDSVKTLGAPVVGVAVSGTNTTSKTAGNTAATTANAPVATTYSIATTMVANYGVGYPMLATNPLYADNHTRNLWYNLRTPSEYVEGTVTAYNYNSTTHAGYIMINGQKVERSLLADAIVTRSGLTAEAELYGNYRAYLDAEGKYIYVEPVHENKFVYGTYIDYTTPYGSSAYEYTMIGVDLEGNPVKQVVKTYNGEKINAAIYSNPWNDTLATRSTGAGAGFGIPYRDTAGGGNNNTAGVGPNAYVGFSVDANGNVTNEVASTGAPNHSNRFGNLPTEVYCAAEIIGATSVSFTRNDAHLGMAPLNAATNADGTDRNTYFTDNTKFIVVDGTGTDTQTVEVYTGLADFLDGASSVTISGADTATERPFLTTGNDFCDMMYYTRSEFTYASAVGRNEQVDTIILPKAAITWTGKTSLAYVGNPAQNTYLDVGANRFWQHTVYVEGEAQTVWTTDFTAGTDTINANGATDPFTKIGTGAGTVADHFITMRATSYTMPNGDPVYECTALTAAATLGNVHYVAAASGGYPNVNDYTKPAAPVVWGQTGVNDVTYSATTYDAQTATLTYTGSAANGSRYRVAGAKVVNLNADNTETPAAGQTGLVWPGIKDLGTLNEASSLGVAPVSSVGATDNPRVSCIVDPADPTTILVIYVCWNQDAT